MSLKHSPAVCGRRAAGMSRSLLGRASEITLRYSVSSARSRTIYNSVLRTGDVFSRGPGPAYNSFRLWFCCGSCIFSLDEDSPCSLLAGEVYFFTCPWSFLKTWRAAMYLPCDRMRPLLLFLFKLTSIKIYFGYGRIFPMEGVDINGRRPPKTAA